MILPTFVKVYLVTYSITVTAQLILKEPSASRHCRISIRINHRVVRHTHQIGVLRIKHFTLAMIPFILIHEVIFKHLQESCLQADKRADAHIAWFGTAFTQCVKHIETKCFIRWNTFRLAHDTAIVSPTRISAYIHIRRIITVTIGIHYSFITLLHSVTGKQGIRCIATSQTGVHPGIHIQPTSYGIVRLIIQGEFIPFIIYRTPLVIFIIERKEVIVFSDFLRYGHIITLSYSRAPGIVTIFFIIVIITPLI